MNAYLPALPAVNRLLDRHDHFDVKTIEGQTSLRGFIAASLMYSPAWMKALYHVRAVFVRFLGMKQEAMPTPTLTPETVPFGAGEWATFFRVVEAQEGVYWIASASDKHLTAYIAIAREALPNGKARFHTGTIVQYHNWAGPVYFNVIRPFHHVVVAQMIKAGVAG